MNVQEVRRNLPSMNSGLLVLIGVLFVLLGQGGNQNAHAACNAKDSGILFNVSLAQVDDNSPLTPRNRICSNAELKYRDVQYRIVTDVPVSVTFIALVLGTSNPSFADGTFAKSGLALGTVLTIKVPEGNTGTWKLQVQVTPSQVVDASDLGCRAEVEGDVFKFVVVPRDAGTMGPDQIPRSWMTDKAKSVIQLEGEVSYTGTPDSTSANNYALRQSKLTTFPTSGMYSGRVGAKTKIVGSQSGYLIAWGLVGVNGNGLSDAKITWNGTIELSGGGLVTALTKNDGTMTALAPQAGTLLTVIKNISFSFDETWSGAIYQTDTWMTYTGTLQLTAETTGIPYTSGVATYVSFFRSNEPLYLNGGSGIPQLSDFCIDVAP